jgi:hypothetical protein
MVMSAPLAAIVVVIVIGAAICAWFAPLSGEAFFRRCEIRTHAQVHSHWVYNHADIDGSRVIWARDLGPEENKRLLAYYPDRQFWLLRPNQDPTWLEPYH